MEQLIPIAAKLQDVLGALGQGTKLDLPQIVVVGGQSSGKSSVLEGVVGRSFLPRGSGIVTRRPLVLQLFNTALPPLAPGDDGFTHDHDDEQAAYLDAHEENLEEDDSGRKKNNAHNAASNANDGVNEIRPGDEWGEFLHLPGRRFYDFSEIRTEIVRDTDRLTGRNKGISAQALYLKIYSPRVLHLTLVDLPGIAKLAVGDQPHDIEFQIRDMCMSYITNPNAIILAVTAGNTDLANSDALQLAQEVDPTGERTIGVITKLDLMDPGTNASEMLQNKVVPLRRGYVGIVNRGQLDIDRDKSIREGLTKEADFFRSQPAYRSLQQKCGTANLAKNLNNMLMHHIRDCLPELKSRISVMVVDIQQELDALGKPTDHSTRSNLGGSLLGLLSKFSASFSQCVEGKGTSNNGMEMNELYGGARVAFIFNEVFVRSLMEVQPFDGLSDDEIRTTICNANGTRASLFVPEISFDLLVRRQISRLEQPGLQCVDLVFDELQRMTAQCEPPEFQRFPVLRERMVEVVSSLLRRCVSPTQMMVSNLIKIELAYINTSHPDFIGGSKAVARLMEKMSTEHNGPSSSQNSQQQSLTPRPTVDDEGSGSQGDFTAPFDNENGGTISEQYNGEGEGGGLINFIFRGKKTSSKSPGERTPGLPSVVQLPQVPDTMRQTDLPTDRERIETEIIKSLIESYFSIVRKNFIDMVPKTIMYFLVNHARDSLQNELVSELYRDSLIPDLMREAEDIAQRRQTCEEMRDLLKKALEIVNEVRDFNTFK